MTVGFMPNIPSIDPPIPVRRKGNHEATFVFQTSRPLPGTPAVLPGVAWAQGTSPWTDAVTVLQNAFTGPIARGLSLIALVVVGLMFAFGEGGSKQALAGIVFGLGMAMGAANFLAWLF